MGDMQTQCQRRTGETASCIRPAAEDVCLWHSLVQDAKSAAFQSPQGLFTFICLVFEVLDEKVNHGLRSMFTL